MAERGNFEQVGDFNPHEDKSDAFHTLIFQPPTPPEWNATL